MYQVKSPILLLIFNRPDTTEQVFNKIKAHRPKKIYIAGDGPRLGKDGEEELCLETRNTIQIDWDCEIKTLYRNENLGCKLAVSSAIKWFFENEEQGIILEDDCLPNSDFFRFCDTLLEKYKFDSRVVHIAGSKMNINKTFGNASYYFSKYTNVWGWASWRRVWEKYDENLILLDTFIEQKTFENVYESKKFTQPLLDAFIKTKDGLIDTWDYQYAFLNFWNNGLCITPNYNMISNIGFSYSGTHTTDPENIYANRQLESLNNITHPDFYLPIIEADYNLFQLEKPTLLRRIKRKINSHIKIF